MERLTVNENERFFIAMQRGRRNMGDPEWKQKMDIYFANRQVLDRPRKMEAIEQKIQEDQ